MFALILIPMIQSSHNFAHACCHAASSVDKLNQQGGVQGRDK